MLGILQFLYLASAKSLEPLARDIYRVARSETQNFPLAVMSINLTKVALDALRRGQLNRFVQFLDGVEMTMSQCSYLLIDVLCFRECNSRGSVVTVLNDFYSAVFCHTFLIWTQQHKTIVDAGHILKGKKSFCAIYSDKVGKSSWRFRTGLIFRGVAIDPTCINIGRLERTEPTQCILNGR